MRKLLELGVVAVLSSMAAATSAQAQLELAPGPSCTAFDGFLFSTATSTGNAASYVRCAGAFFGNDAGSLLPDVMAYMASEWGFDAMYGGTTDGGAGGDGPFGAFDAEMTAGTLVFDVPVSGLFGIALKADGKFSLYQFDTGGEGWTSLYVETGGVALNASGGPQALSHGSLFLTSSSVVPEPGAVVLLGTGLLGLALVARRRKDERRG